MRTKLLLLSVLAVSLFSVPASAQISDVYIIPAAANAPGAAGTRWATEIHIFNPQPHRLDVSIVFIPAGGSQAREEIIRIEANETAYSENILQDLFDVREGTGALSIATFPEDNTHLPAADILARSFVAGARVYNNAATGTYGQRIPGSLIALMEDDLTAIADGVRNTSGTTTGFRTNIGGVNLGRFNVRMYVQAYAPDGAAVGDPIEFMLPPFGHAQDRLPVMVDHGSLEFWMDDADPERESLVFPYMSVVDNRSGDAVYVTPSLLAFPSELAPLSTSNRARTDLPRVSTGHARALRETAARGASVFVLSNGRLQRGPK